MIGVPIVNRPGDWAEGVIIVDPSTGQPAASSGSQGGLDTAGRTRVSQLTTLFDGKLLNSDDALLWDTKGTGTATWVNSGIQMSVTAGQYVVRQSLHPCAYFSGKNQNIKITFDTFQSESGLTKVAGYFNSAPSAPYTTEFDGAWLESTPTSYKFCVANAGVKNLEVDFADWDGYESLANYDWSSFSTIVIDFLWLGAGGTDLRFFVATPAGLVLAHTYKYTGTGPKGPIMRTCQHSIRFEIRSTTGTGNMNAICSQVSSEGSLAEVGYSRAIFHPAGVAANSVGTVYAIKGLRALASRRDLRVGVRGFTGGIRSATSDSGVLMLLLNPTLSAPLTWVASDIFDDGTANSGQTVTGLGTVLDVIELVASASGAVLPSNLLSYLPVGIDNTMGQIVLAYRPTTANQTVGGTLSIAA